MPFDPRYGVGGMAAGFRTIILAGLAIGGVGGFVVPDLKLNDAVPIQDRGDTSSRRQCRAFWRTTRNGNC